MNEHLVVARNLSKNYGATRALDDLSFTLGRGEILGVLGPNGAGKTTLLHILLGLLTPSAGEVLIQGYSPLTHRHIISSQVNFSSAYGNLPLNLKVSENLNIFSLLYGIKDRKKKVAELLDLFEIAHLRNRLVGALSSGEKTKLNLAKCFLNDPVLLVLDEPTASLDPDMSDRVRKILKDVQRARNIGIVYTSHNMFEVEMLCDRIIFIHHGRCMAEGTSETIRKAFSTESLEQVFIKVARGGEIVEKEMAS